MRRALADKMHEVSRRGDVSAMGSEELADILRKCQEVADEALTRGDACTAYDIFSFAFRKTYSYIVDMDSSYGGLGMAAYMGEDFLQKLAERLPFLGDEKARAYILKEALKDATRKEFDGWGEAISALLEMAAGIVRVRELGAFHRTLEAIPRREYSFTEGDAAVIRHKVILTTEGKEAADEFLEENVRFRRIRDMAIEEATSRGDDAHLEELCLGGMGSDYGDKKYLEILEKLYLRRGDREKYVDMLRMLLMETRKPDYYKKLRAELTRRGTWVEERPIILAELKECAGRWQYNDILACDGDKKALFESIKGGGREVFDYAKALLPEYKEEVYALCVEEIEEAFQLAIDRRTYRGSCELLKKLAQISGTEPALAAIEKLKAEYPRRSAMQEELYDCRKEIMRAAKA